MRARSTSKTATRRTPTRDDASAQIHSATNTNIVFSVTICWPTQWQKWGAAWAKVKNKQTNKNPKSVSKKHVNTENKTHLPVTNWQRQRKSNRLNYREGSKINKTGERDQGEADDHTKAGNVMWDKTSEEKTQEINPNRSHRTGEWTITGYDAKHVTASVTFV